MVKLLFLVSTGDMKIERPLSSLKATNGLMSGYAPRPHKRKRKGLRLAVFLLLAAVASLVAVDKANANYIWECQDDITWELGQNKDITMIPPDDKITVLQWILPEKVRGLSREIKSKSDAAIIPLSDMKRASKNTKKK